MNGLAKGSVIYRGRNIDMSHNGISPFIGPLREKSISGKFADIFESSKVQLGFSKSKRPSSNPRSWQVIPNDKRLWVFRDLERFPERRDIFDMYDILRQRTLRIFCGRELLHQVWKRGENLVGCLSGGFNECTLPECGELGLSWLSICVQRSIPVDVFDLGAVFLHRLCESISSFAADVF